MRGKRFKVEYKARRLKLQENNFLEDIKSFCNHQNRQLDEFGEAVYTTLHMVKAMYVDTMIPFYERQANQAGDPEFKMVSVMQVKNGEAILVIYRKEDGPQPGEDLLLPKENYFAIIKQY
jgi:hypothetical protein